jgi:hypothetical protein
MKGGLRLLLLILGGFVLGCDQDANRDSDKLDRFLAVADRIDRIVVSGLRVTNVLKAPNMERILRAFEKTNRINAADSHKTQYSVAVLAFEGTNRVFFLDVDEDCLVTFGSYHFKLREGKVWKALVPQ